MKVAGDPILEADQLTQRFNGRSGSSVVAFQDVSLDIARREFVSVIGPSGCGKSSLLRLIAGLSRPASGVVKVEGQTVSRPGADRGMVFQEYALLPWKTTLNNVGFGLSLKGLPRHEVESKARYFMDLVGLSGSEDKYPHQLSGGMRQRAAVARALANNPKILLMDEPFAAVDAMTRRKLQEDLAALTASEGTTVLFVTHSIEEAIFLSDRIVVLFGSPSRLVEELRIDFPRPRTWSEIVSHPTFVQYQEKLTELIHGQRGTPTEHST